MKDFYLKHSCDLKQFLMHRWLPLIFIAAGLMEPALAQVGTINAVPQNLSPEAAALGKFVEVPVSNYSGLPEINIPIYTLNAKDFSIPASLSYHASGVKVKEIPGWVGANWALNAGGMISRIVRGTPDRMLNPYTEFYKEGIALMGTPGHDFPDPRMMPGINAEWTQTKVDTEYDLFYFNFMGYTGRFTFDNSGAPMMMQASDMKVNCDGTNFTLTDAQGIIYEFNVNESWQLPNDIPYPASWHLSKIVFPHQSETIDFNYKRYDNNMWLYRSSYGPDSFYERVLFEDVFPPQYPVQNPACPDTSRMVTNTELSQGQTCVLRSITYKSDSIKFYHDTTRADVYKLRLDSIRVFQGASVVNSTRLSYTFSNSGSSDFKDKKMLLSSVQSNDQPAYSCSYYGSFNGKSLPGPYIHGSDLWGYYNGGSYNIHTPINTPHHPDYRYGQIGSLQTLSYPTGGNTEFIYEGNDFSYCQQDLDSIGPVYQAGGLRIKKIKFTSPVSASSFEKSYEYTYASKSSGILESPFANHTGMMYWGEGRLLGNPYCNSDFWPQVCTFYTIHHDNTVPLGNAQGGAIGYAQVTEWLSDGSKKVMQFTNGGIDRYNYDPLFEGWGDGYNSEYLGDKVLQDRLLGDYSAYRGKLKNVAYYNSSGQKIKQEVHQFSNLIEDRLTFSQQPKSQNLYAVLGAVGHENICAFEPTYGTSWGGYFNIQRNIVPTVDSLYTFNGSEILKEVVKYEYSDPLRPLASRVIKIGTKGDSTITVQQYAYTPNMVLPIETYVLKKDAGGANARVTDAQLIQYQSTPPVMKTVYRLHSATGLTDFVPFNFSSSPASGDARYRPALQFHRYDGQGHVTEQGKDGQAKEVLVWGYERRFIVARITSSDYPTMMALVDSTVLNNPSSEAAMRSELAKIRTGLASANPKAKVTSYTYETLKGMTSSTDPRGNTTYYEYDAFGRLKRGKDPDAQVKENLWYHFKP